MLDTLSPADRISANSDNYASIIKEHIREFIAHQIFRSATVDELILDDNFFRRPLRPEDLSIVDFNNPLTESRMMSLSALMSQRILLSIGETTETSPPKAILGEIDSFLEFYSKEFLAKGDIIKEYLEDYSFGFLWPDDGVATGAAEAGDLFGRYREEVESGWRNCIARVSSCSHKQSALNTVLIQKWHLDQARQAVLSRAAATGRLSLLTAELQPRPQRDEACRARWSRVADAFGLPGRRHRYWQFYLPTALAQVNHLRALADRPDRAIQFIGAAFYVEMEWQAFSEAMHPLLPSFATPEISRSPKSSDLGARFKNASRVIAEHFGQAGVQALLHGLSQSARLQAIAQADLTEQVRWLGSIETYQEFARLISERIAVEMPNIDRETFVEPRAMCSTTHIHDDHRLVVIESGDMVFWGTAGMVLRMKPGEMLLVPQGRLHGSSVETDSCTYHQPIIPEDWIGSLTAAPG